MDQSILQEFIIEAQDHFETIEDDFLRLAEDLENLDRDLVDKVFRAIHSVKGGAGFLQLTSIAQLSHAMESLLSAVRADEIKLTREIIDALLAGVDTVNSMFEAPEESNNVDIEPQRQRLMTLLEEASSPKARQDMKTDVALEEEGEGINFQLTLSTLKQLPESHEHLYLLHYDLDDLWKSRKQSPVELVKKLDEVGEIVDGQLMDLGADLTEGLPEGPIYYDVLFSTLLGPETIGYATGLDQDQVTVLDKKALLARAEQDDAGDVEAGGEEGLVIDLDGDLGPADEAEPAKPVSQDVLGDMAIQFASEADEQLESLEEVLCRIFDNPGDTSDSLREAFRLTHSFKGNAGLVGANDLEKVSHTLETAFDFFRETTAPRRESDRSVLFAALDGLKTGVASLADGQDGAVPGLDGLVRDIQSLTEPSEPEEQPGAAAAARTKQQAQAKKTERNDIRVDLAKLDDLMNLVGELVIGEAMVTRNPDLEDVVSERFERAAHNLRRIVSDLQDVAMSVRMVPLSRTFRRMIRLVHDLSAKAGKKVRLDLVGEDTEVDKTVIEQVGDPLVHLIRNSVDHGLETPEERLAAGKPETGVVTISAGHEGGEVVIKVADDGRGLPRDKILDKAKRQGLVTDDGSRLSDEEVYRLIFEPGFSTAEKVTDISGRGVGMDVVKRNLEKIKGRVDVRSTLGKGATMILRIPLTLAIIDGMLVRVGTTRYTIPLLSIRQSFRPVNGQISKTMDGQELANVRGELVPVVRMHEFYNNPSDVTDLQEGILICVGSDERQVCLFADEILGHHQTVIKAMPGATNTAQGISGCTILGDGEVSLILDVENLMEAAEHAVNI